jgi:endonuclease I
MRKLFSAGLFLLASVALQAQTTLPTSWNFSAPGIANPPAGWTLGLGTNGNLTYAFGIGDALSCRLDATGEFAMIHFADKPGPLSYYLSPQNAGNPWGGQFDVQESSNGTTWNTIRSITSKATTATNFTGGKYTDVLQSATRYVRFFYTSKLPGGQPTPGGNMALDSVLIQAAPAPPTANLVLKQGATTLVNNAQYVVGTTATTNFTIENKGTVDTLFITNHIFTGNAAADYTISNMPAKIAPKSSAGFTLNFTAGASGSRQATLELTNSDPDKSNFTLRLYGIGGQFASEPASSAGPIVFTDIKPYAFKVAYGKSIADQYLVLRKTGSITETPADGSTYRKGDYIGAAQVAYVGTDSTLLPTYILAGTGYHFAVFPFNGPAGFENYKTSAITASSLRTPEGGAEGYYNSVSSTSTDFVTRLSQLINPHDTVFYSLYIARMVNNFLTRDTTGGKKVVNCVYTRIPYVYDEPFVWWSGSSSGILTREHTFSQSWMPSNQGGSWPNDPATGRELPEYNDLHNLFPAEQALANGKRSNFPFGEIVGTPTFVSPTGLGKLGKDANNNTVYEPADWQKGEVARALFYMVTAYNGINGRTWALPSGQNQDVLKKWHFQDLPDALERARHELIYDLQGNRNPFIDSPNFACRINFSNMSWVATPDAACGTSFIRVTKPDTTFINLAQDVIGAPIQINWVSQKCDSVKIEFLRNDTAVYLISASAPANPGTYFYPSNLITNNSIYNDSLRIKVTDVTNPATFSLSKRFKIRLSGSSHDLSKSSLQIYPNPVNSGSFTVLLPSVEKVEQLCLFDMAGKQVTAQWERDTAGSVRVYTGGLRGMYVLRLRGTATNYFSKIICK